MTIHAMTTSGSSRLSFDAHRQIVDDVVEEAWILMGEAVMVLPPNMGRQQIVERCDRAAPRDLAAYLQPLRMLIEH